MAKGTITPFYLEPPLPTSERYGRSSIPADASSFAPTISPRSSVLSSVVLPYLRRQESSESMHTPKTPLLTLKLSSASFLDSDVNDDLTRHPLYTIRTTGTSTTVSRSDPWAGVTRTADVKWPKLVPTKGKGRDSDGVLLQMKGGRWQGGDSVLKPGSLSSARKFNIPQYSQSLKWKRVGTSYWCTTPSVKGPIAKLDPAIESVPPRLKVYETLRDKYDGRPLLVHNGVSILLLDYLLVTSMLLVTDVQEWMVVRKYEGRESTSSAPPVMSITNNSSPDLSTIPAATLTSQSQWRKIMYREPLFPKLSNRGDTPSPVPSDIEPPTPTSARQMAKIIYGDPLFPTLRTPSPGTSISVSDDDDDDEPWPNPNPSAHSIFFTHPNTSAPSHTYLDPTFYDGKRVPPVPQLPSQYARSSRSHSPNSSMPSSATGYQIPEGLPAPPRFTSSDSQPWPRSRSTPPRATPSRQFEPPPSPELEPPGTSSSVPGSRRPSHIPTVRTYSIFSTTGLLRKLPQPPTSQSPLSTESRDDASNQNQHLIPLTRTGDHRSSSISPRSLPPIPIATPIPRSGPSSLAPSEDAGPIRQRPSRSNLRHTAKKATPDVDDWVRSLTSSNEQSPAPRESFDTPPPAYNTINFAAPPPRLDFQLSSFYHSRPGTS